MSLLRRSLQRAFCSRYSVRINTQRWNSTASQNSNGQKIDDDSKASPTTLDLLSGSDTRSSFPSKGSAENAELVEEDADEVVLSGDDIMKMIEEDEDDEVDGPQVILSPEPSGSVSGRGLTGRNLADLTTKPSHFYALPDPVWDNTEQHVFQSSKRAPLRYDSRVLDTNWTPMFFDLDEIHKDPDPEFDKPFNINDIDEVSGAGSVDENEIRSPLHHLPIPFNELDRLHRYPLIQLRRTHQTGKGKTHARYSLVVVGNGNGLVGIGEGKAEEPAQAMDNAFAEAVRNIDYVDRFENRTLWSEMELKFGSTRLHMRPRPVGFGLMCAPGIHQVFKAAGIKDASAKIWGSRNKINVIKTTIMMLHSGHQPLGMGDGIGGRARRPEKKAGMRSRTAVELERGRRLIDART